MVIHFLLLDAGLLKLVGWMERAKVTTFLDLKSPGCKCKQLCLGLGLRGLCNRLRTSEAVQTIISYGGYLRKHELIKSLILEFDCRHFLSNHIELTYSHNFLSVSS